MRRLLGGTLALATIGTTFAQQVTIQPRAALANREDEVRPDRMRVNSTLVLVPVEVSDRIGRPVSGLEKQNFHVYDDQVEQRIVSFAMEDDPVAICLVFDISGSMAGDLPAMRIAAARFFKTSNPSDQFCLVELATTPHLAVPLSRNAADVDYRLMFSKGGGSTALLDGVYLALNEIRKSKNLRKALVIISDGGENHSRYTPGEVKNAMQESDVLIYAISTFGTGMGSHYDGRYVLKMLTQQTGGRMYSAGPRFLDNFADKIVIDLRNRYLLGYRPSDPARDGRHHSITVKLTPPRGLRKLYAHWRRGYYAPYQ